MSIARHHTEWLSLIEISGPFVSLPVLSKVFPQGLDERDAEKARNLRSTFEAYQEAPNNLATQLAWVKFVLSDTLSFYPEHLKEGQEIPPGLKADLLEHRETLRPDIAVVVPRTSESGEKVQQTQLLVSVYLKDQDLDAPIKGTHWKASPATRMAELLHASDVPLGLVTNGERWMLVYAPRGETTGFTSWYASLWFEEPKTLRAFHSLLSLQRVVGSNDTLLSMLRESASDQQEVTDKLGRQVRDAVDVLVSAFSRLNIDAQGKLLEGISEKELYNAALTVMMRLVFLFCAEERGMLHLGKPLYDNNYAVSTLREQLQEDADQHGEEVLERRSDAWVRLLATFRAVYGGVTHEDLSLPAYGGSLFNPDRYAFLEGRPVGTEWTTSEAAPPKIDNRVVLHLLRSLQMLQDRDTREARRLSFRALDIEQIGHVYEGLLDHTAVRAEKTILGLEGSKKLEPMRSLEDLEAELAKGEASFLKYLKETTGRSESALKKALSSILLVDTHKLMISCHNNHSLFDRVLPFAGLLRQDSFEMPLVILKGSVFVTSGTDRRSSGTHYTPRTLTEPVVKNTLEPLVYVGPAEGLPREAWKLRSPREILELKVCDMAMGSGAFLTEACRYLAERLVEAWEIVVNSVGDSIVTIPGGGVSQGDYFDFLIPNAENERIVLARRFVADRCIYGVDINPMAVEIAKLSMWLITLQKDRPFTFLDHSFKCGDSLIGVTENTQIQNFSLRKTLPDNHLLLSILSDNIEKAADLRMQLENLPSHTLHDIERKQQFSKTAGELTQRISAIANYLVKFEFENSTNSTYQANHIKAISKIINELDSCTSDEFLRKSLTKLGNLRPFHWNVEFPEVFIAGGFHAFVGNPPFLGGSKITQVFSEKYRDFLVSYIANGIGGRVDLAAYFFLRSFNLCRNDSYLSLVSTNSIYQGDSREASLKQIILQGGKIYAAVSNMDWPGAAGVHISILSIGRIWHGKCWLDGSSVDSIDEMLSDVNRSESSINRLSANKNIAFRGTEARGEGFIVTKEFAMEKIENDNSYSNVLFPYLGGEDLNTNPNSEATRWIINFHDWPLDKCMKYPELMDILYRTVKPYRDTITKQIHEPDYWKFWDKRLENYAKISNLKRVIVCAAVSPTAAVTFVETGQVYQNKLIIFPFSDFEHFGLLQSSMHWEWVRLLTSTLRGTALNYSPTDCFETFPFPTYFSPLLSKAAESFYRERSSFMLSNGVGLTKFYNQFNDSLNSNHDIARIRDLQIIMDIEVAKSYNFDLSLIKHGFSETRQGIKFTLLDSSRRYILQKLQQLNSEYYNTEQASIISNGSNSARKQQKKKGSKDPLASKDDVGKIEQPKLF